MTLRTLNYGSYGIFLIMGHAGLCPSTVWSSRPEALTDKSFAQTPKLLKLKAPTANTIGFRV